MAKGNKLILDSWYCYSNRTLPLSFWLSVKCAHEFLSNLSFKKSHLK